MWIALPLLYWITAQWSAAFVLEDKPLTLLWPAIGVLLPFTFHFGAATLLPGGAVATAAGLAMDVSLPLALGLAAGNVAAVAVGAWVLRRGRLQPELRRLQDVLVYLGTAALASVVYAIIGAVVAVAAFSVDLATALLVCWIASFMAAALFGPLLITVLGDLATETLGGVWRRVDPECLALFVAAPVLTWLAYAELMADAWAMPLSYAVFPLVLFAALRKSPASVGAVLVLTGVVAFTCTGQGKGPFASDGIAPDMLSLYSQYLLLALTGLLLAAARQEGLDAERRARLHLQSLERTGRLNAMGSMAAGVAHELNQPLCAVSNYAHTARRLLQRGADPADLDATLQNLIRVTERASGIVGRVRKLLAQSTQQEREYHELNDLVREVMQLLQPELERRRVQLVLDLETEPLPVHGHGIELQQVVTNLLQNACDATVERPWGERSIRIFTRRVPGYAELVVRDTGPGLPAGDRNELFEPLVTRRRGGTGLGLAISRSIIESHGGRIHAEDAPGHGAQFRVCLPLSATPKHQGG